MGFKEFFKRIRNKDRGKLEKQGLDEENQIDWMTFEASYHKEIEEAKAKIAKIQEAPQEDIEKLNVLINDFEKSVINIQSNVTISYQTEPELSLPKESIESQYAKFILQFNELFAIAEQKHFRKVTEKFSKRLEKSLFPEKLERKMMAIALDDEIIEELEKYEELLEKRKEDLTGNALGEYMKQMEEIEYRLSLIKGINQKSKGQEQTQKIEIPKQAQEIYVRLFMKDIGALEDKLKRLKAECEEMQLSMELLQPLQETIEDLKVKKHVNSIEDNNADIVKDEMLWEYMINAFYNMQRTILTMEKYQKQKQDFVRLNALTQEEVRKYIKELDDRKFDVTTSYKDIRNFEDQLLQAKGLVNDKNLMRTEDIETVRIRKNEWYRIRKNAEEKGIHYSIYPEVDENQQADSYVSVSKKEADDLLKDIPLPKDLIQLGQTAIEGIYTKELIQYILDTKPKLKEDICVQPIKQEEGEEKKYILYVRKGGKKQGKKIREKIEETIKELEQQELLDDYKFYIEFSYLVPMTNIIKVLQRNHIEYYIPPLDEQTKKQENHVKIYMDREFLKLYEKKVKEQLSQVEEAPILTKAKKIDLRDWILEGSRVQFLEKKEKQK
ncbi:MAG: hypothetical protein ACLU84_04110 [Clostridia bacterium]